MSLSQDCSTNEILDDPADETLLDAKWESLALAPVGDSKNPDDYFLFTAVRAEFVRDDTDPHKPPRRIMTS
jgi:hypothetical protein